MVHLYGMAHRNRDLADPQSGGWADRRTGFAMKAFFNFMRAVEHDMGWCRVEKFIDGRWVVVEEYGRNPLADKTGNPKLGYWQAPNDRQMLSTVEDEDGL